MPKRQNANTARFGQVWPANRFRVESPSPMFPQPAVHFLRSPALRSLLLLLLRPLLESPSFPSPFLAARPFSSLRSSFHPFPISFVPDSTFLDPNRLDSSPSFLLLVLLAIPSPSLLVHLDGTLLIDEPPETTPTAHIVSLWPSYLESPWAFSPAATFLATISTFLVAPPFSTPDTRIRPRFSFSPREPSLPV
ncbi:uncharacterized protein N7458_008439 [Penicillium daleae]|uniref:Transmembrane protein n=1 Tax=Penicillium daleae TaxID=63821 RepID=A0AAD6G0W9_9EURO|nr:uncharacterized protein N7458_008439 [Penicillium daleae]KAJ5444567.1 hypothetical protein N7458_008439 [Penicillium daleae]